MPLSPADARVLWRVLEPVHAVTYFAPEVRDALKATGLRGFWMGYHASRVAPMGAIGPEIATAVLHNFAYPHVARALPDAWGYVTPQSVLATRSEAVGAALDTYLAGIDTGALASSVDRLRPGLDAADLGGRALFAAYRALPWPDAPRLALWHAATLLREHRGDGHIAALTVAGLSGLDAHVLATGVRGTDPALLRDNRGWSTDEWEDCRVGLERRGLITGDLATEAGRAEHAAVEDATDLAALDALGGLGPDDLAALLDALAPAAQRIAATGMVPFPNPIGLPRP